MQRLPIVLFMLLLSSASAIACHDEGQIAQNHGDAAMALHEFSSPPVLDGAIGRKNACVPLRRVVAAGQHHPYPLENSQKPPALLSSNWDVQLDRGQIPKRSRFRNLAPNNPSRFIPIAEGSVELETTMWRIVKESKNPADYEAYLDIFPNGRFAKQARETLTRLRSKESSATSKKTRGQRPAPAEQIERIERTYTVRTTANLRQAPSIRSKIVGQARKGQELFVLGRTVGKNWYQISTSAGGVAYIAANLIEIRNTDVQAPAIERKAVKSKTTAPIIRDDKTKDRPAARKEAASPAGAPSPPESTVDKALGSPPTQQESRATQGPPDRKSPAEIEEHWNRRIDLVKESGPHGNCLFAVGDQWSDPPEYDLCEERNEEIKQLRLQMERELAGHQ